MKWWKLSYGTAPETRTMAGLLSPIVLVPVPVPVLVLVPFNVNKPLEIQKQRGSTESTEYVIVNLKRFGDGGLNMLFVILFLKPCVPGG